MDINSLQFFDKNGNNLNLEQESNVWIGNIYFSNISTYLYDNENIFILEKVGSEYKFPTLNQNESFSFKWESNKDENTFFIYDVEKDIQLNENFISKVDSKEISHSDLAGTSTAQLDLKLPMQLNIAFSPIYEISYSRILEIYYNTSTTSTKIAEIQFYGEGIEEDERFRIWAENFGIKFIREDANILKEYDIKEAIPDYKQLNQARKELLVSKENIYPYIGTYKGLNNFIKILGYSNSLQIKEYWKNVNTNSSYFNKMYLVDISDYLDDGIIDTLNLVDRDKNIKRGKQFKKTEFLAIVYQFTRATDSFDDDGIPIVEETTEFTVNEIFYKLNLLNDKLKSEFLPVNVKIRDIIGEFIYFQKITINYWQDSTQIFSYSLNQPFSFSFSPSKKSTDLTMRSIDPLYNQPYSKNLDLGIERINVGNVNPYQNEQKYNKEQNTQLIEYINTFYTQIKNQRSTDIGKKLSWETGDDPEKRIGAPIILSIDTEKLLISDLKGVKLEDLDEMYPGLDPYWTLENIDYRNFFEITWEITKPAPNPYKFSYRGNIKDLNQLAHFLPYTGEYRVIAKIADLFGNITAFSEILTVQDDTKPRILAYSRLEDKFDYHLNNLKNVQLQDFGASTLYYPKVNVLDNENAVFNIDIYKNLIEWISFYKNRYGLGQNINDVEILDTDINKYVPFNDPLQNATNKSYWGLGEDDIPITIKDFKDIKIDDLYWLRLTNLVYLDDFKAGFYIQKPGPGKKLKVSLYSEYTFPNYSTLEELVDILNNSDHPAIKLFNYEILELKKPVKKKIIHAQARFLSKITYHILSSIGGQSPSPSPKGSPTGLGAGALGIDKYTFFLPRKVFSKSVIDLFNKISPVFDDETMFLLAKTSDVLSGAVQDPSFWVEQKYWEFNNDVQRGHLPTTIDQNAFNITDIKLFEETFVVPENAIVFFVVNNIDSKNEFIWTLTNYDDNTQIIKAKSVPFFVWKFKDLGRFTLSVEVIDSNNNRFSNGINNFIQVFNKVDYITDIETRLNHRKRELLNNRVQI